MVAAKDPAVDLASLPSARYLGADLFLCLEASEDRPADLEEVGDGARGIDCL